MEINVLFLEIQVGLAVMIVLPARVAMRKLPKVYSYLLWLLVFARLLVPVSFESRVALMPSFAGSGRWLEERFDQSDVTAEGESAGKIAGGNAGAAIETVGMCGNGNVSGTDDDVNMGRRAEGKTGNGYNANGMQGTDVKPEAGCDTDTNQEAETTSGVDFRVPEESGNADVPGADVSIGGNYGTGGVALLLIWAVGVAAILIYNGTALLLVKKQIRGAKRLRDNIYTSSQVKEPFTLGVFAPEIYLPPDLEGTEREYIICHEQIHIRRRDYLVKNLAFLLTAVHWFNPFVWAAFYFMGRDMEMSCDETVIRKMGQEIKKQYSQSLLNFARGKCPVAVTPITFGENSVKQRVSNVLAYQETPGWAVIPGAAVLLVVLFMTFTVRSDAQESGSQNENSQRSELQGGNWQKEGLPGNGIISDTGSDTQLSAFNGSSLTVRNAGVTSELLHASLMLARRTPEGALEYWARAYTDRNGDILFQMASDKEKFGQWEKVTQRGDSFAFGESSPWPWGYDHEILMSPDKSTADIIFHMRTSVPEIYLVKETVKIAEQNGLYCVDHGGTWDYYRIETAGEYTEAYGRDGGHDDDNGDGAANGYDRMAELYDDSFYRAILIQLVESGNPDFYQRFTDPVAAARELLHLGAGTGEVTEWHIVSPVQLRSADAELPEWASVMAPSMMSSMAGEGSRVILTYTFAKDGSQVEILMELKEESQGIWGLTGGGIRKVYHMADGPEMIDYDEEGRARGVYVIELSNYGIYRLGAHGGLTCLWAGEVDPEAVTKVYEDKIIIFENPKNAKENSDDETESVFVWDISAGELYRENLIVPQDYEYIFPETDFGVEGDSGL